MREEKVTNINIDEGLNEKEVFKAICGVDEDGINKSIVSVKVSDFDIINETETVYDEIVLDKPVVNVMRTPSFTSVDLTFSSGKDFDFLNMVARLEDYRLGVEERIEEEYILPTVVLTLFPKEFLADVYCTAVHGSWVVQPSKIDGPIDTIRFVFENDYVYIFEVPEEVIQETDPIKEENNEEVDDFDIWSDMYMKESKNG